MIMRQSCDDQDPLATSQNPHTQHFRTHAHPCSRIQFMIPPHLLRVWLRAVRWFARAATNPAVFSSGAAPRARSAA